MMVGTISGNETRSRRARSSSIEAFGAYEILGRSRFGVWSIGAEARLPWKVWPTTTVSIAPFASCEILRGSGSSSAEAKRLATFLAASAAPRRDLS